MATFNSRRDLAITLIVMLLLAAAHVIFAGEELQKIFAMRAEAQFHQTQSLFKIDGKNFTNAWQFGRACFDFADFSKNDDERADTANQGIAACHAAIALAPVMPMPGMLSSRWLASLERCCAMIRLSIAPIIVCNA